ncbi:PREDICTED: uncharacterized protein LOC109480173 [Branchiostoma belcheri]|uniref:Uncharacterized protein LOC109480173 n=1 Tax=Branchiostoma belcheri TaxID=7741 RepID=A0A6P5A3U0_BRABE|nr:PREDICTED: uncharacterized protein LOC109480173 [Branchiostoma belcheri]
MNVLKIILVRDFTESSTAFLSSLENGEMMKMSEETNNIDRIGDYKLYEYSCNTLSGTIIFTPEGDDERAIVEHFRRDDTPYASLPVSVLDENKSHRSSISSFSDMKFLHHVLGIIIRATGTINKRLRIYLAARNESTLEAGNKLIKGVVDGLELDIEPFHAPSRRHEELLREKLSTNWPCKVLCCVDKSARNIILHDTESDEASQIVRPAEDICGKDGVLLLLCGHRDIDGSDLYDKKHFSTAFLCYQPKLREIAASGRFLSMESKLNESQKKAVLEWIQRPPDDSMKQPSNEGTVQCPTNQEITQNAARKQSTGIFANLLSKFANTENVT